MDLPHLIVLGRVHHEDALRTESQRKRAVQLRRSLVEFGFDVIDTEEFHQDLRDPGLESFLGIRRKVFRRLWAQEIHHLREFRRRQSSSLKLNFRKLWRVFERTLSAIQNEESVLHKFRRLEIEAALSLKHFRIWKKVTETDSTGAIVLEDDFSFSRRSSPADTASLVGHGFRTYDLIDLAGGLTRKSLGLPDAEGKDLSLSFIVSNTTCAYFISRRACSALVEIVEARRELVYLAPDFLITELNVCDFTGSTLLPYDLPLVHGSWNGVVDSSIPY